MGLDATGLCQCSYYIIQMCYFVPYSSKFDFLFEYIVSLFAHSYPEFGNIHIYVQRKLGSVWGWILLSLFLSLLSWSCHMKVSPFSFVVAVPVFWMKWLKISKWVTILISKPLWEWIFIDSCQTCYYITVKKPWKQVICVKTAACRERGGRWKGRQDADIRPIHRPSWTQHGSP
jgi:hypothetical protein